MIVATVAELKLFSVAEFNRADNVACDELNELRVPNCVGAAVRNARVTVAVFVPFPLVSTNSTVVGCPLPAIAEIDDDNDDVVASCAFCKAKEKQQTNNLHSKKCQIE